MKKHIKIDTIILLVILLTSIVVEGALSSPLPQEPPPGEIRIGAQDNGGQVRLGKESVLAISLEANPSTGYGWEVAGGDAGTLLQMEGDDFEPYADLLSGESPLVGVPGMQTLYFLPKAQGTATLQLVYRRPWEEGVAPLGSYSLQVETEGPFIGDYTPPAAPADAASDESLYLADEESLLADEELGALPANFNWCKKGKCTPIKNQGNCGSCWAFATAGVFESKKLIEGKGKKDLSEQYLVSCNTHTNPSWGCSGGWFAHDWHWNTKGKLNNAPGARYESQFAYKAKDLACKKVARKNKLTGWAYVNPSVGVPSVTAIKAAIKKQGPVAVAICIGSAFRQYKKGVFKKNETCVGTVNHAVILVGWSNSKKAWLLRNSWGTGWGMNGYMWIKWGTSKVGYAANYVKY